MQFEAKSGSYSARVGAGLVRVFGVVEVLGGGGGWRKPGSGGE